MKALFLIALLSCAPPPPSFKHGGVPRGPIDPVCAWVAGRLVCVWVE